MMRRIGAYGHKRALVRIERAGVRSRSMTTEGRRESPNTPKRAAVQAAVLRATEDLLAEGGNFADLGIERIATRAGISRTAFYFYFADKRELLMRLTEEVNALLFEQADIWFSRRSMTSTPC
jgi:AcrR family transcriptional regulator